VAEARGYFGNPEEVERSPLVAATRRRVKAATENTSVCVNVIFKM
jgi:hypothetical protein